MSEFEFLPTQGELDWPPGVAGQIAQTVFACSIRPVKEISITGAIAMLAGLCGRAYTVSNTGLNLNLIIAAKSAVGKEAVANFLQLVVKGVSAKQPTIKDRFQKTDYASAQALIKGLVKAPCFTNIIPEFGHKFESMTGKGDANSRLLKRLWLDLYSASGPNGVASGLAYSDQTKNVPDVRSPAYTAVGDTTQEVLFENVTLGVMSDGFLSRWIIVDYQGERPDKNPNLIRELDPGQIEWIVALLAHVNSKESQGIFIPVGFSQDASMKFESFDKFCDVKIRAAGDDHSRRQMYNRAGLNVMKIAALIAIADNPWCPQIEVGHLAWVIDLLLRNIAMFEYRLNAGDIGDGDDVRTNQIKRLMREFKSKQLSPKYVNDLEFIRMRDLGFVPRSWIRNRAVRLASFSTHKLGADKALDAALMTLQQNSEIVKVPRELLKEFTGFTGNAYCFLGSLKDDEFNTATSRHLRPAC